MDNFWIRCYSGNYANVEENSIRCTYIDITFRCHEDCTDMEVIDRFIEINPYIKHEGILLVTKNFIGFEVEKIDGQFYSK